MNNSVRKTVIAAMMAALCCAATLIHIPVPGGQGYVHPGDVLVLFSGWMLGPAYGFAAAATGSALADLTLGYIYYAPATFFIKGTMALLAALFSRRHDGGRRYLLMLSGAVLGESVMVGGYFLLELWIYDFGGALIGVPYNLVQAAFGVLAGMALSGIARRFSSHRYLR